MKKRFVIIFLTLIAIMLFINFLTMRFALALTGGKSDRAGFPPPHGASLLDSPALPAVPTAIGDPVDCNILPSPVVGYEISKGQLVTDMASFLTDLAAAGYGVGTVDIGAGPIPNCVDVLIVQGLAINFPLTAVYTAAEGSALQSWVASGHGLMLNGDWGPFKPGTQALFQAFGYTLLGDTAVSDATNFDPTGPGNLFVIYQADNFVNHPILNGVAALELLLSAWLSSNSNAIITTDGDAVPASVPVMAAFIEGAGCAVLTTDSNWADNHTPPGYLKEDNALAARQTIEWLATCDTLSLSKTAAPDPVSPGQLLTYDLTATNIHSTPLSGVLITDTVPVGTSFVDATAPYTGPDADGVVSWSLGALGLGGASVVTMTVQVDVGLSDGSLITNTARVSSAEGLADTATAVVTVAASSPTAVPGGPYNVNEGGSVLLDGSGSSDPNGDPLSYAWDLDNDGLFDDATGATTTFSAAARDDGAFPVALLVDNGVLTDTGDTAVTVNNVAPQVTLTSTNWILTEGQSTNFVGSFVDPGTLDTHSIVWDFGDGSGPTPGALNENYTYVAAGQYTVTLTITDDDGGVGIDSGLVTVLQQISPPTAAAGGPYNVNEGGSVLLNGGGSTDPNNLPLSYAWDWDNDGQFDDAVGAAATFSAAVLDDGVQSIALQVSNGIYTDTEGTAVTILNVAPQVTFDTISWQILAGETAAFTGDFTDPGRLDTHTIVWDFGDSGTANGSLTPSHLYANTGQYVVTLTVQDDDNGIGQATHQLQVVESFLQYLPIVANNYCSAVPIPADIILAIDTSSSMSKPATTGGTKLDAAKEAAAAFIDLLDFPHDQAGIVSFANSAILEHALSVNAGSLHNAIQTLVAAGITRMDKAVFQSRQELTGPRHNDSSSQIMILLTDGQPNGTTPEAVRAEANMAKAAGIVIYTIGLGSDIDTTLMRDIATSPDHYYEAPSAADLNDIYIEIATQIHCK